MKVNLRRILRNYRSLPPTKFHNLNQRVRKALADESIFPPSIWAASPNLIPSYFAASDKHDAVYHEALFCNTLVIAEREILQKQITSYLDEIAAWLEAAAVQTPDILLASGFDLTRERRSRPRTKNENRDASLPDGEHDGGATA